MIPLLLVGYKAVGMVVLTTVLNIGTLLICCWYCFARLHVRLNFKNKHQGALLKEISSYSFYVFLTIIVDRAFWSTGQFILGMLSGTKDVAIYSIVVQFCNYYMSFSVAISGVFLPKMTQLIAEGCGRKELSEMFIRIGRIQYLVMAYILFAFALFGRDFIYYWAGGDYRDVYPLAIMIMIPQTIPLIQNLGIAILQAQNRQRFRSFLNVAVSLISVFIGYELTKRYGIYGCAFATSVALLLGHGVILNWYYHTKIHLDLICFWKQILKLTIPAALCAFFMAMFMKWLGSSAFTVVFTEGILYSVMYVFFMWKWGCNEFEKNQIKVPLMALKTKIGF